ncbi:hypothetical protein EJ07DRAFT_156175 [Lizonia empirigonia]|nr:hypothetical protein EJ07DRAFT_156175 [Lizonia empirigonia]
MLYSAALVLATLAVGQAAAANHHNRHSSFHARRQADAKRSAGNDVNWKAVAYDLNDVDWDKVNWSSVFSTLTSTSAEVQATPTVPASSEAETSAKVAPTSSSAAVVKVQEAKTSADAPLSTTADSSSAAAPTSTSADAPPSTTANSSSAAAPTSTSADAPPSTTANSSSAAAPTSTSSYDAGDLIGDLVSDLLEGVEDMVKSLGIISTGKNDKSNNGAMWVGDDGDWRAEFTNDANEDAVIFCWKADGFSGMCLNVNQPEISVGLKSGQRTVVSFASNVPSACAPAFKDTKLANFGGLDQTWWEVTFGQSGAFDVSRNVNMKGRTISSKGSKCTSDMNTCVFKCKDENALSCESGTDYDLFGCGASTGGGGGYDAAMAGTGGGCAMGSSSETVKVSFS